MSIVDDLAQPDCAQEAGSWCARFYEWTNNDFLARSADTIVDKTVTITVIVVVALIVRRLLHKLITRVVEGAAARGAASGAAGSPRRPRRPG